ncbi:MAG: chromosome segregation protein SMC, partial [Thermomonas sp.]
HAAGFDLALGFALLGDQLLQFRFFLRQFFAQLPQLRVQSAVFQRFPLRILDLAFCLQHLARQSKQAEQYTAIQAERRIKDAQWKALEFRSLDAKLQRLREKLAQDETRLEQLIAEQREAERELETGRGRRDGASEALNAAQAAVYQVGSTLAGVEQQMAHQRDLATRLQRARDEAQSALSEIGGHISGDQQKLDVLRESVADAEPRLATMQADDGARQEAWRDAEARLADWQQRWDAHSKAQSEATRAGDVERTRIEHLDRQILDADRRREQLGAERTGLDVAALSEAFTTLQGQHDSQKTALDGLTVDVDTRMQALTGLQEQQRKRQAELAELRKQAQAARGRLASLETLQHAALGQEQGAAVAWLKQRGLDDAARVGERLQVESGWENAVEAALGQLIEGVLVDQPETLVDALGELADGRLALVSAETGTADFAASSLASKVRGPLAIRRLLSKLHAAETLADARNLQAGLADGESVITRAGERLGDGWVRVLRSGAAKQGALLREKDIQSLRVENEGHVTRERELDAALTGLRDQLLASEQQREDAQRALYLAHRGVSELAGQVQSQQGRLDSARGRIERIDAELAQLASMLEAGHEQSREARQRIETAVASMGELETARQLLDSERRDISEARDAARNAARESRDAAHALALTVESQRAQIVALAQALERMGNQRGQLDSRLGELASQLTDGDVPVKTLENERQAALSERVRTEQALAAARSLLEGIDNELRGFEHTRQQRDGQALQQREAISQRKLDQQALAIKADQFSAAVIASGFVMDEVLAALVDDADAPTWEKAVADFDAKLRRLEPVNLAAIAEHAEAAQRKEYLDAQDADLTSALDTLEDAIRKIDRETRGRFKDTFDRVNSGVQELYPRLFGGGHAYLELTGEDLLDAGVTIMARPPGKRVSSISLLSGGEKAMTAVALVFAIFRLNPAPFCLLDEVDAPLDESNVARFTNLVSEMSEQVQFLFVTHNKATMEAAQQLSGVTMR